MDSVHRSSVAKLLSTFAMGSQIIATTFRPELLPYASNIIGCNWDNQVFLNEDNIIHLIIELLFIFQTVNDGYY